MGMIKVVTAPTLLYLDQITTVYFLTFTHWTSHRSLCFDHICRWALPLLLLLFHVAMESNWLSKRQHGSFVQMRTFFFFLWHTPSYGHVNNECIRKRWKMCDIIMAPWARRSGESTGIQRLTLIAETESHSPAPSRGRHSYDRHVLLHVRWELR